MQTPETLFQNYILSVGFFGELVPTKPLDESIRPIDREFHLGSGQRRELWRTGEAVKPLPGPSAAQRRVDRENEILYGNKK